MSSFIVKVSLNMKPCYTVFYVMPVHCNIINIKTNSYPSFYIKSKIYVPA